MSELIRTRMKSGRMLRAAGLTIVLILGFAAPAPGQFDVRDLGYNVTTQDIQADSQNTVHVIWTYGSVLFYGRIVNNAISGAVEVATGVDTVYWRPYVSVQPDGSSVHTAWTTAGMGNMLMHSWKTTGEWRTETVLTVPSSQWLSQPACAVDSSGVVHLMFVIWNNVAANEWATVFYMRKAAGGKWEAKEQFAPLTPEYKHPMLFVDSHGRVHATWDLVGASGGDSYDAYYCSAPSGGRLYYNDRVKIPKAPGCDVNGYGDLYVDRNGTVHRSIGGWSNAQRKMCIDHAEKPAGGNFKTPTRASVGFLDIADGDPVPAVAASEDGQTIVAWGQVASAHCGTSCAFDPHCRGGCGRCRSDWSAR